MIRQTTEDERRATNDQPPGLRRWSSAFRESVSEKLKPILAKVVSDSWKSAILAGEGLCRVEVAHNPSQGFPSERKSI